MENLGGRRQEKEEEEEEAEAWVWFSPDSPLPSFVPFGLGKSRAGRKVRL